RAALPISRAPAGIAAQGRVALVEAAAAQAPVHFLLAVAGKRAVDDVAAGLLDADGQRRPDAVVIVAAAVALGIGAHVEPPLHALARIARAAGTRRHALGAGTPDRGFDVRQHRDLARAV